MSHTTHTHTHSRTAHQHAAQLNTYTLIVLHFYRSLRATFKRRLISAKATKTVPNVYICCCCSASWLAAQPLRAYIIFASKPHFCPFNANIFSVHFLPTVCAAHTCTQTHTHARTHLQAQRSVQANTKAVSTEPNSMNNIGNPKRKQESTDDRTCFFFFIIGLLCPRRWLYWSRVQCNCNESSPRPSLFRSPPPHCKEPNQPNAERRMEKVVVERNGKKRPATPEIRFFHLRDMRFIVCIRASLAGQGPRPISAHVP